MENDQDIQFRPRKLDLFSTEAQQYLRDVVRVLDFRNFQQDQNVTLESSVINSTSPAENVLTQRRYGCNVCDFESTTLAEQRDHFQSDWHLFNLRRRLKSKPSIKEEIFEQILAGTRISTSTTDETASSDSSSSDEELENETAARFNFSVVGNRGGAVYFVTKTDKVVSCYRSLLTPLRSYQVSNEVLLTSLRRLYSGPNLWIILVVAGGHFAGAVFDNTTNEAVVHKTFHRYTVRAKQGGSQSKKDAQGGKIKSAGAMLRRYNEEALCKDIRNLVRTWGDYVCQACTIFLRCSLRHRYIFYADEEPLFLKTDQRIRNIPFVTMNPTYEETRRILNELASVDVYDSYESFSRLFQNESDQGKIDTVGQLRELSITRQAPILNEEKPNRLSKGPQKGHVQVEELKIEKPKKEKGSTQELNLPQHLRRRLYTACKSGDAVLLRSILDEQTSHTDIIRIYLNSIINDKDGSTFLHLASASGHLELLKILLEFGCDPTMKNLANRVPFQVANGKATRTIFSQFRNDHPVRWNWNAAQIPESVDPEIEASRKAKMAERRKAALKAKAEKLKVQKEEEAKTKAEETEKRRFLELSDREKRALAAERRWQAQAHDEQASKLVLSRCFRCGLDITGKVPFEYSENRFCSMKCVKEHRMTNS